jgi:hypothetical protein
MTKEQQENETFLAVKMFGALGALYAADGNIPDWFVASIVRSFIAAGQTTEEAAPAKPKQRRARRKKADIVALAVEAATNA